jgi:hypothetical protein
MRLRGGPVERNCGRFHDRDEGARYTGEWSIAFHPFVKSPCAIFFSTKRSAARGTLALGNAYDGNLEWQLVGDCTGTWCRFSGPNMAGEPSNSMARSHPARGVFVTPTSKG